MWERIKSGMSRTRERFTERMNVLLDRGPDVDEEFWDGLEEALILSDVGAQTACDIVENMREEATRHALPDAYAVMDALTDHIAAAFTQADANLFDEDPVLVLFVGINGAGKTTTVGKIAYEAKEAGRNVLLGCADTFRAAAIEQLEEWGRRADVEIVERERGSDPASVCYDTIERAEAAGSDLVLIDTAGRLHTSDDLMRELQKVVNVVRKRSAMPVRTVLVIDATTGQNGLSQAREFDRALDLDAVIVTKLDGTARGGIALAVSHELGLPVAKVGVGEGLADLQDFDAHDYAAALIGAERKGAEGEGGEGAADAPGADGQTAPGKEEPAAGDGQTEPQPQPEADARPDAALQGAAEPAADAEAAAGPAGAAAEDGGEGPEEDFSADAEAAYLEYEAQRAQGEDAGADDAEAGPDTVAAQAAEGDAAQPGNEDGPEQPEEEEMGRFRRLFHRRERK